MNLRNPNLKTSNPSRRPPKPPAPIKINVPSKPSIPIIPQKPVVPIQITIPFNPIMPSNPIIPPVIPIKSAVKRALLLGLLYKGTGNDLYGCENDIISIQALLKPLGIR